MRKKSASGVLARHCRLTGSAAFTNVTRVIPRVVNLSGSTYRSREKSLSRQARGRAGKNNVASPLRIAAALLDGLFEHPARALVTACERGRFAISRLLVGFSTAG